jgi:SAM-dependent methyltransferase
MMEERPFGPDARRRFCGAMDAEPEGGRELLITKDRLRDAVRPAYGPLAGTYEQRTAAYDDWRHRLIALLPVTNGDVVLDVGCGTGLCFPRLQSKIGVDGRIIGIDESPDMLDIARGHIADSGWENVTLITAPADEAEIPVVADAAVFSAVHDIMQSQPALDNVFAHLRPGAWVAAVGGKWARAGILSLDPITYTIHQPYVRSFAGFDRPWRLLEPMLVEFTVTEVAFGTGYLALGRVP